MKDLMTESAEKTEDTVQPVAEVTFADFNVRPEIVEALAGRLVARIDQPAIGLKQRGGA